MNEAQKLNITVVYRLNTSGTKTFPIQVCLNFGGIKDEQGKYIRLYVNTGLTIPKSDWNSKRNLPNSSEITNKLIKLEQAIVRECQEKYSKGNILNFYKNGYLKETVKDLIQIYVHGKRKAELEASVLENYHSQFNTPYPSTWINRFSEFNFKIVTQKGQEVDIDKFFDQTYQLEDFDSMIIPEEVKIKEEVDNYPIPFYEYILIVANLKMTKAIKNKLNHDECYITLSNHFKKFNETITLGQMTDSVSSDFINWVMKNSKIKKKNSKGSIVKSLRAVFSYAIKKDKFTFGNNKPVLPNIDIFDEDIYGKLTEKVGNVYLNDAMIDKLATYQSEDKTKEYVAHLFAINASGFGARFSDIHKLFNVEKGHDSKGNEIWTVNYRDKKVGVESRLPISDKVYNLIKKYDKFEKIKSDDFNDTITLVLTELGLNHPVTYWFENLHPENDEDKYYPITKTFAEWTKSHTCKRSFCTNAKLKNIPNSVIRIFSHHSSDEMLDNYVKATDMQSLQVYIDQMNN